jgi:hypothetical protein
VYDTHFARWFQVRADGSPGGWRRGIGRKQKLLESEARANPRN